MNLEDVINPECGLQQDNWSLTKPTFGEHNQLEVIGWSGKARTNNIYILRCRVCSNDPVLYGDGIFASVKSSLVKGAVPCGCAVSPRRTEDQCIELCNRNLENTNITFVRMAEPFKGVRTKITLRCNKHGEWSNATFRSVQAGRGCPQCKADLTTHRNLKPDSDMIASFFASGAFHPDTKFWRSDRKTKYGTMGYWNVHCPECNSESESYAGNLQSGNRPCSCGRMTQKQAYISTIEDSGNTVAIKFGIARSALGRIKEQQRKCSFDIKLLGVWVFESHDSCRSAERVCETSFQCSLVPKTDMSDGYTETTSPHNLEAIMKIYEEHGGIRIL